MSHDKLAIGWVGAPLLDAHLNETVAPWPSHQVGLKNSFNPETDGPHLDKLHCSQYISHFGGNAYNAAVANAADNSRFKVHMLWGKGKSPEAEAIEEDMRKRDIVSHAVYNVSHQNGGSFVKAMLGDRGIVTMQRTPLHETIKAEHVHAFLHAHNLGAVGISSLKSPELNAIMADELRAANRERTRAGLKNLFTVHNPGSGEFNGDLLDTWGTFRHSLIIGNRDEFSQLFGEDESRKHALRGLNYADITVVSDGTNPLQVAYAPKVLTDRRHGGIFEMSVAAVEKSQVVDTTGAGDRLTSTFTSATYYAQRTGELTVNRLVGIAEFAVLEAGSVVQYLGGHGDKPYLNNAV